MVKYSAGLRLVALSLAVLSSAHAAEAVHPELWRLPIGDPLIRPEIEAAIDRRMAAMSLEDKIGQMLQADVEFIRPEDLARFHLGALLAGGDSAPNRDLRSAPQAWLDLVNAYEQQAGPIPLLFGIDAVHGDAKIVGATIFPHNIGLGAAGDSDLVKRIAAATAQEVAATGFDWVFAPTLAVARDPRWGRTYESYSEDPKRVANLAGAAVAGFVQENILSTAKHFIGDGGTLNGRDESDNLAGERELLRIDDAGYPPAIAAGDMVVMLSYNAWHGEKMMANRALITDVLKGAMHFDGFVIGDWNAQEQVPGCSKFDCPQAINAGVDMLMAPDSWRALLTNLTNEVRGGAIPMARIDDAVRRILRVKYLSGAFDRVHSNKGRFAILGNPEHRRLAAEAVRKSLVLLKNERHLLPIDPASKILVAGAAATEMKRQMGGWTIDWQGDKALDSDFPGATSIFAAIAARARTQGGTVALDPEGHYDTRPDVAVVIFGEEPYAEYQGDLENLDFSRRNGSALALLKRLREQRIPTIAILLSGRPLWVNPELNASDAFIAAWLPGSEGEGIADLLFPGPYDFTGRLPFSWPRSAMPVRFDTQGAPLDALFPIGYGLGRSQSSNLGRLPEDPSIPSEFSHEDTIFDAGHVTAPWSLFVVDDRAETRVTTAHQASPDGAVTIAFKNPELMVRWSGERKGSLRFSGRAADFRALESDGGGISLRYRLDSKPDRPVLLEIGCGKNCRAALDVTAQLEPSRPGEWRMLEVPYSRFAALGADLSHIDVPLALTTAARIGLQIERVGFTGKAGHDSRI